MLFTKFVFGVCHTIQVLYQSYWYEILVSVTCRTWVMCHKAYTFLCVQRKQDFGVVLLQIIVRNSMNAENDNISQDKNVH